MDDEKTSVRRLKFVKTRKSSAEVEHHRLLKKLKDEKFSVVRDHVTDRDAGGPLADLLKKVPNLTDLALRLKIEELLGILKSRVGLAGALKSLKTLETLR